MELNRIDAGTGKSPVSQGRAAAATADSGFEAVISDEGVELSSSVVRARGETSRTVPPQAGGATGPPVDASTRDLEVQAQPAAEQVASPSGSGNWRIRSRGRSARSRRTGCTTSVEGALQRPSPHRRWDSNSMSQGDGWRAIEAFVISDVSEQKQCRE